ncbi:MAG TPA: glycosyltransferase family 4 protein [Firmicutes bacterium]|nr:glycosyltransferase family 4 protein [Bacillota bacterium]
MKILMLSWEYPPKVIGGLARAVADLSQALVEIGHEVAVVTGDWPDCEPTEYVNGVRVYRANQFFPKPMGFLDEVHFMNYHLAQKGIELLNSDNFDLVHAHDWLVAPSAKVLKHAFQKPLIATIHATEWGRNNGLHNDLQRHISDLEWWLTYEAYRVICCSRYMEDELRRIFQVPEDKLHVIPNGVRMEEFSNVHADLNQWRNNWARPEEDIVLYVGRHVFEKGIDLLLEAALEILPKRPCTKFIIAGKGPMRDELMGRAWDMGLGEKVLFPGFIDDQTRNSLYRLASAAVFPSRYEPFGIVALEAMAGEAPVIVSDVGGFYETVEHGVNGLTFYAGNAHSLADSILRLLQDKALASALKKQALKDVSEDYNWETIALETLACYGRERAALRMREPIYERYHVTAELPQKGAPLRESSNHGRR